MAILLTILRIMVWLIVRYTVIVRFHISPLVFALNGKVIFPCVSLSLLLLISNEDMSYKNVTRTNFWIFCAIAWARNYITQEILCPYWLGRTNQCKPVVYLCLAMTELCQQAVSFHHQTAIDKKCWKQLSKIIIVWKFYRRKDCLREPLNGIQRPCNCVLLYVFDIEKQLDNLM